MICPTKRNGFDVVCVKLWMPFFKFCILQIKFNYTAPFFLSKLVHSWCYLSASSCDPFLQFFDSFLCRRLFNISQFVCETFLTPWNLKCGCWFTTNFHCCSLIRHSVFCSISHRQSFLPHLRHNYQSYCFHLNFLQVGRFLLLLSLLKHFLSHTYVTQRSPPLFVANIVKSRDESTSSTLFPQIEIWNRAVWY